MDSPVATSSLPTPSASPVAPHASIFAFSASKPPDQKQRRLPPEGVKVLREFYDTVSTHPTPAQAQVLLAEVLKIPSCSFYTLEKVKAWFINHRRQKEYKKETKPDVSKADVPQMSSSLRKTLYPSFTKPRTIEHLHELHNMVPDPTEEVLAIWATRLEVNIEDIKTWRKLSLNRNESKPDITGDTNQPLGKRQLPTPQSTASPEPNEEPCLKKVRAFANAVLQAPPLSVELSGSDSHRIHSWQQFAEKYSQIDKGFDQLKKRLEDGGFARQTSLTTT
ncbi:hypothetical protein BXZ70DRAFT_1004225 [Cristinia sonorae]|uniref:Homeobox domain-containing protein n=1 Tax=Cristinia sonorae TaxID=1940300 RepID=A0A8K0UWU8_9AGAR|nr:hypothetical protein BXZ70DRAFT_1004225 [Cristinia sonorae]